MTYSAKKWGMVTGIVLLFVAIDQWVKIYIHSHFYIGECVDVLPFFKLCYVENDGMAFGIEWFDKLFLTLFRLLAVGGLLYYIHLLISRRSLIRSGYLVSLALILAGALGNLIDCIFYGKWFGYADWFYGRVVDMLYFPIITSAEGECLFFRPVFNIADSCITIAIFLILLFYRRDLDGSLSSSQA